MIIDIVVDGGSATALYSSGQEDFLGEVSSEWLDNYISNLKLDGHDVVVEYLD
jgi:hypothetical protein